MSAQSSPAWLSESYREPKAYVYMEWECVSDNGTTAHRYYRVYLPRGMAKSGDAFNAMIAAERSKVTGKTSDWEFSGIVAARLVETMEEPYIIDGKSKKRV